MSGQRSAGLPALLLTVALTLAACPGPVQASQTVPGPPSVETLARQADVVVIGDVSRAEGERDPAKTGIVTRVHLERHEVLKGSVASPLSFTRHGGRVGNRMSAVGGAARFAVGERVLVFLTRDGAGALRLGDLVHGKFRVERDAASGREYAVRATGAPGADRVALDQVRADVRRTLGS